MKREDLIKNAIQNLDDDGFEKFACELLSRDYYPGLIPTSPSGDLGEDAHTDYSTLFLHDGKWISLAISKESTWGKIKKDCDRCTSTNRNIDILVFVTTGSPQNKTIENWKDNVNNNYEWILEVKTIRFLSPFASRPDYEDIVDQYLNIPPLGGDFINYIEQQFAKETKRALRGISNLIPGIDTPIEREELKRIEDQIMLGKAVLFTGEAGTGKSAIASQLASKSNKSVVFLDARRLGQIKNDTELRNHFDLKGSIDNSINRLARQKGCRVIIDQIDNSIELPISNLLIDLALDIQNQDGVEIILVSRKREVHEIRLLEKLTKQGDFIELNSNPLSPEVVKKVFLLLGIEKPSDTLLQMGKNLLNLEVIGRIILNNRTQNFDDLKSEIDLWGEYIEVIREREGDKGDACISEAIRLSILGIQSDDHSFTGAIQKSYELKRLESWNIIICEYGRIYRFHHEKLQDYLYAFDATERGLSKQAVIDELGDTHRTRNIYILIQDIYHRKNPSRLPYYLREAWNV